MLDLLTHCLSLGGMQPPKSYTYFKFPFFSCKSFSVTELLFIAENTKEFPSHIYYIFLTKSGHPWKTNVLPLQFTFWMLLAFKSIATDCSQGTACMEQSESCILFKLSIFKTGRRGKLGNIHILIKMRALHQKNTSQLIFCP